MNVSYPSFLGEGELASPRNELPDWLARHFVLTLCWPLESICGPSNRPSCPQECFCSGAAVWFSLSVVLPSPNMYLTITISATLKCLYE